VIFNQLTEVYLCNALCRMPGFMQVREKTEKNRKFQWWGKDHGKIKKSVKIWENDVHWQGTYMRCLLVLTCLFCVYNSGTQWSGMLFVLSLRVQRGRSLFAVLRSFKVTDFGTNRNPVCGFLLVNSTFIWVQYQHVTDWRLCHSWYSACIALHCGHALRPVLHHFQIIVDDETS